MHLYYYHYSKKFNILHSFDDNVHLHTVEAELIFLDESQDFDKFGDMEEKLAQYFQYFDNQYLNELKEFKDTVPTIENLGYVLFENLKILMSSTNYKLVKLNIGENPSRKYTITDFLVTGNITKDSLPDDLRTEEYITEHYAEVLKKYNAKKAQMKLEQEKNSLAEQGKQNNQSESDNAQGKALQEMSQDSDTPDLEEVLLDTKNVQSYEFEGWNEPPKPITLRSRIIALYGFVYTTIISALFGLYLFTIHSIPNGDEIYLHLGKAKYLYNEIVNKQFSPIYMLNWFNGYLMFVKSPPLPYYLLALCQWITGGDIVLGYYILVVFAMCIGSYGFVEFGKKCDNAFIGIILGILWLFNPETIRVIISVGDIQYLVAMAFIPHLFQFLYQYLKTGKKSNTVKIALTVALIMLSDFEVSIIAVISIFIIFVGKAIYSKKGGMLLRSYLWIIVGIGLTMPWLYEAIVSGRIWTYHVSVAGFKLDVVLCGLILLGVCFIDRINRFYLGASFILLLLSIWLHPYFLTFAYMSFFIGLLSWKNCRKPFLLLLMGLLFLNIGFQWSTISGTKSDESTFTQEIDAKAEELGITKATKATKNRFLILGIGDQGSLPVYYTFIRQKNVLYSYGIDNHSLVINSNIEQLKYALYTKHFSYIFDRSIELGCDVVLISKNELRFTNQEIESLKVDAKTQEYELIEEDDDKYVFKKSIDGTYGTITEYEGLAIGSSAKIISIMYPYFQEGHSTSLDDYDLKELKHYKKIYLSGITYKNSKKAEEKVRKLSEAGVEVLIDMDSIPTDETTGRQKFLGVTAQSTVFNTTYPTLLYKGNAYKAKNFSKENTSFNTVYLENMDQSTGYIKMGDKVLNFCGTKENDNIQFISFNMLYHTLETNDEQTNRIISDILGLENGCTPKRELVKLSIDYHKNKIKIKSDKDNVNTTLAYQDEFYSADPIEQQNNLLIVNKGETIIEFSKNDLKVGIWITIIELLSILYFILYNKIEKKKIS